MYLLKNENAEMRRSAKLTLPEVLAATVALGHLFTVNDSTMGAAVKKHLGAA